MNKKKLLGTIAALAIAATVAFNVNLNSQEKGLSDVYLANVKALADCESGVVETEGGTVYVNICKRTTKDEDAEAGRFCFTDSEETCLIQID